jgi:hypothetical protein
MNESEYGWAATTNAIFQPKQLWTAKYGATATAWRRFERPLFYSFFLDQFLLVVTPEALLKKVKGMVLPFTGECRQNLRVMEDSHRDPNLRVMEDSHRDRNRRTEHSHRDPNRRVTEESHRDPNLRRARFTPEWPHRLVVMAQRNSSLPDLDQQECSFITWLPVVVPVYSSHCIALVSLTILLVSCVLESSTELQPPVQAMTSMSLNNFPSQGTTTQHANVVLLVS